jgi:aryl-alcohol dehydrogenase-like predicted oxidoreductase
LGGYQPGPEPREEPDVERAARVIGAAIECVVKWIDTSENYLATHDEGVIGAALQHNLSAVRTGRPRLALALLAPGL